MRYTVTAILALSAFAVCHGGENLLVNGDFSIWEAGRPTGWTLRSPQEFTRVEGPTPLSAALQVAVVKPVPGKSGEIVQRVGVKVDTRYGLSGQLRGEAGLGVLQVKRYKGGKELDRTTSKKNAGDAWTPVRVSFDSGNADAVEVLLRWGQEATDAGKGVAFAGLALEELGEVAYAGEEVAPRAVPTFNSLGLYWKPQGGSAKRPVTVQYREPGAATWSDTLPLWFDPNEHGAEAAEHTAEYRGSIVYLKAGTTYEVKLALADGPERLLTATTWSDDFKIARTVAVPATQTGSYTITEGGSPEKGYVLYAPAEGTQVVWDAAGEAPQNVEVNASYVIVRGLTLKNAKTHGIRLGDVHHVVVERCDISGWGETGADGQAKNLNAAVYGDSAANANIVVQHCALHHPRSDSNSWNQQRPGSTSSHPIGPQGIVLKGSGGGHVIRFNRIYSDMQHMFNDGMGETKNFSYRGFPGWDTDIHDNFVSHCWDDGLEVEGANMNVRVWNNYIDMTYGALGAASPSLGPVYFFRNVYAVSRKHEGTSANDLRGHYLVKLGNDDPTWVRGRMYVFHNTTLQPPPIPGSPESGSGAEAGLVFTSDTKLAENIVSRNNVLHMRKAEDWAIRDTQRTPSNDYDYDLYDGKTMFRTGSEAHGIIASPTFATAPDGRLWLAAGSPGHDAGERLPNFNDGFVGTGPDMGAVETDDPNPKPALWPVFPPRAGGRTVAAAQVPETSAVSSAQILLDVWPKDRIFESDPLVLPTAVRNLTGQPLACAVRTVIAEYRPNEDGETVAELEQTLDLPASATVAAVARPPAQHPLVAGPYEFRITLAVEGQGVQKVEGTLLYKPREWALPDLEPKDFDAFWRQTLAELRSRPLDPQLAPPVEGRGVPAPFQEVSFNGLGDRRIRGYLGLPPQLKPGQKAPAILSLPSAGYHSAAADSAAVQQGYVFLAISIHDLPFGGETYRDHPRESEFAQPYQGLGRESKETFYYRAAYAAGARAVEYLRSLPEVDLNRIVVTGFSQGGSLALATAGLVPDVALAEAGIAGRSRMDLLTTPYKANMSLDPPAGMTRQEMLERTLLYYDVSYFARRVRSPFVLKVSLDDETNPGPLQYWISRELTGSPDFRMVLKPGLKHQSPPDPEGIVAALRRKYAPVGEPGPGQE